MENYELPEEEKKPATISIWAHENAMTHKDMDNERMLTVVKVMRNIVYALCVALVIVVITLVAYYTSRTAMWNDTITKLTTTLAEVTNAKDSAP